MFQPAIRLRKGDVITVGTRDGEHIVNEVTAISDELVELELLVQPEPVIADPHVTDTGHLINVVSRHRQDHVKVTWTLLDPMADQIVEARRTDRVDLTYARANGYDDVTGIQRILATKQFSDPSYASFVIILSVREV